ncbi:MAG: SDR family NAD(P)-dependent oxidoreductase [Faecalibacterium sp.]
MSQKTVWITGASSGIGQEFARRYAKLGFRLILTARRTDRLEALAAQLGAPCRILPADLARESECARLCQELDDEPIDIFINNAGFGLCGPFAETPLEQELELLHVNVEAMHYLFKFTLRKMKARGAGLILNVASSAGLMPGGPYMAAYYASKAYVVSLTRAAAEELREERSRVTVCALCPGPVDTEFNDRAGVVFALPGITPQQCVDEAFLGMKRRKIIIVPSALMRVCTTAQKLVPASLLMSIVAHQQRKKLG